MVPASATLGTLLRRLTDELDGAVVKSYALAGLDFKPRYTPVVRALLTHGPMTIGALAETAMVSHPAASQTVSQMATQGLVSLKTGPDARERLVHLTPAALSVVPALQICWAATETAARSLDADLGISLVDTLIELHGALEKRPFLDRILHHSTPPSAL